jgi:hypothetical protein
MVELSNKSGVTIVTGLWDLGRGEISESFRRGYDNYLEKFANLLKTDVNMYIFIDPSDEEFIWKHRDKKNTIINKMTLDELKEWFTFTREVRLIRNNEDWSGQAGWLSESPQSKLDGYNPLVMSKMFMLNNVTLWNPFNDQYFFWIDAGITNTVNQGYFTHDRVFENLPDFIDENNDFVFLAYPYEGGSEIHGFERTAMARYCNTDYVKYVCRGGFFGGKKERVNQLNGIYYSHLSNSLQEGLMGTEESIFTIMMYNHPDLITKFNIEGNGLIWPFFEDLKDGNFTERTENFRPPADRNNVGLYVLTFNSPKQLETLFKSMLYYDNNFLSKPTIYVVDNSTDESTLKDYQRICNEYNAEHLKMDENLGVCGGRQYIAEHADKVGVDFYFFFEDDMFFYNEKDSVCRNGFPRYQKNLYDKVIEILDKEEFDFLKMSFSEFYGDNSTQWSWYNVPQSVREEVWPKHPKLPKMGLDPNAPNTKYNNILSHNGLAYATGEIYYSNWPQLVSRDGNKKMFLDVTWAHPYEQTWMSYMFQETLKDKIKPGILLLSPTEHDRFDHYDGSLRKES